MLIIRSLDDLKNRLAKGILIVRYFEHVVGMGFKVPLDLMLLAGEIALIGLALFLTHEPGGASEKVGVKK